MSDPSTQLPDPDQLSDDSAPRDVVIYDGECNFCRAQVKRLRGFDWGDKRLAYISLHDPRVKERYPDLSHDDLMRQMYVVDPQGNRHGGADAVRYLSRRLPFLWPAAPVLHLPGTARLWRWLYNEVAKRRYKISGRQCEDACSVHLGR